MPHSKILLNDGSSAVLLNDGISFAILNVESTGVGLHGNFDRVVDFRDFRAPAKRFAICIIDISCRIQIYVTPLVESKIRRSESTPFISRIRRKSAVEGISKIYHDSLHEVYGRITHSMKLYEIRGNNFKQDQNKHYNKLLEDIESKKQHKNKLDEIKDMFRGYKDEF